jgi:hypothetical protein
VARVIEGLTDFEGFAPKGRAVQDKLAGLGIKVVESFRRRDDRHHARDNRRSRQIPGVEPPGP